MEQAERDLLPPPGDPRLALELLEMTRGRLAAASSSPVERLTSKRESTAVRFLPSPTAGCSTLVTEDLQHGADFAAVRVENPFR